MKNAVPIALAFWLAAAAGAAGAPLKCADVAANPARLLHIDFDAMRQTYIGQYILYELDKPEMHSNMVAFQSIFSFDLRSQLHGMTIYGASSTPNESVVITYADFDPAHLAKLLRSGKDDFTITNNHHVICGWVDKNKNPGDPDAWRYATILRGRMIAGNTQRTVLDALAVVDGKAHSFSPWRAATEFDTPGVTNFVLASARNLKYPEPDPTLELLKSSRWVKLTVNESDDLLKATLTVDAGNEQTARQMALTAQGLIIALSLERNNPSAAKLADGMTVQLEPTGFRVNMSVPSKEAMAALKDYNEKKIPPKPEGQ